MPDIVGVDRNLQALRAIETSWEYDAIPDLVKVDLATQSGLDPVGLTGFMGQLRSDLQEAERIEPVSIPVEQQLVEADPAQPSLSAMEKFRELFHGVALPTEPPVVPDPGSNVAFKQRAIDGGYLSPDTPLDNQWYPGLSSIAYQMSRDDWARRARGGAPGPSREVGEIAKWMDDWLSPSGLLSAAVELDFLPDIGQIAEESRNWGDKVRSWLDDPTDPGKLVDAVTGPIDDIVMPIFNWGLMLTGVGEIVVAGKALQVAKGIRAADSIRGMYRGSKVTRGLSSLLRAGDPVADVARFQEPGFIASKLARSKNPMLTRAGAGMKAWRERESVVMAKKVVQQGMKLGFASRLEDQLPNYSGTAITDLSPEVAEITTNLRHNPLVWGVGELMFSPRNLFEPGSWTGAIQGAFGSVTNLGQATRNQKLTKGWIDGVTNHIAAERGIDAAEEFSRKARADGPQALADELAGGDSVALGSSMAYVTTAAAIDVYASRAAVADEVFGFLSKRVSLKDPGKFDRLTKFRDQAISQLRHLDEGDLEGALWERALVESDSMSEARKRFEDLTEQLRMNPNMADDLRETIRIHNDRRQQFWGELMDGIDEQAVSDYVPQVIGTFGRWGDFDNAMTMVDEALDLGELAGARFSRAISPETGALLDMGGPVFGSGRRMRAGLDEEAAAALDATRRPQEEIINPAYGFWQVIQDPEVRKTFDPFAKSNPLSSGRFTVARWDTQTAQELHAFAAIGRRFRQLERTWRQVAGSNTYRALLAKASEGKLLGPDFHKVRMGQIDGWLAEIGGDASEIRRARRLARYMAKSGVGPDDLKSHIDQRLTEWTESPVWSDRYGIESGLSMDQKLKALGRRRKFTARQVDPESLPEGLRSKLQERGYKLVYGQEFMVPSDLRNFMVEAEHMSGRQQWMNSLGNFFKKQPADYVRRQGERIRWQAINRELAGLGDETRLQVGAGLNSADMKRVQEDVREVWRARTDQFVGELDTKRHMNALDPQRMIVNLKSHHIPLNPGDMALGKHQRYFLDAMQTRGYTAAESMAVWRGLKRSRELGFKYRGLANIEDHLRSNPNLTNGLRVLSRTNVGKNWGLPARVAARGGEMIGRNVPAFGMAGAAMAATDAESPFDLDVGDVAVGLSGFLGGRYLGGRGVQAVARRLDDSAEAAGIGGRVANWIDDSESWSRYAYLADTLAYTRDYARFSLSPIFDASRYSEGLVLAQLQDLPEDVVRKGGLRFNQSPSAWRKTRRQTLETEGAGKKAARDQANQEWDQVVGEFRMMAAPDFEWDTMEATSQWFSQVGILGFNPTEWMASTFADLRRLGVETDKAYDIARRTYTYGLDGRSPLELSMNFVFFPFSFMKKTLGHASQFMAQDLSRAVAIHDMIKSYEILDENYDLSRQWRERLPFLERAQRLNLLNWGVSLGEFGGQNRPIVDFFLSTPIDDGIMNPVLNAILPQAIEIKNAKSLGDVQGLTRRLFPVWNDMDAMLQDAQSQGHVLFGGSGQTEDAEVRRAYAEYTDMRNAIDAGLRQNGEENGIGALNKKKYESLKVWFQNKRWEISQKYPAWQEVRSENTADSIMVAEERRQLMNRSLIGEPLTQHERDTAALLLAEEALNDEFGEPGLWTPQATNAFLSTAVESAGRDDRFIHDWRKFFYRRFGKIEREIVS